MELELPYWAGMNILESVGNRRINEVPYFYAFVAATSDEVTAGRVEIDRTYPVLVALSGHDVLLVLEVPDLPSTIITSRGHYLFLSVECHTTDSPGFIAAVGVYFLVL